MAARVRLTGAFPAGGSAERRNVVRVRRSCRPAGDTPAGQWKYFERLYTTVDDPAVDNIAIELGFRGSSGRFRVDDVRVVAVD